MIVEPPRMLTDKERTLLEWLVEPATEHRPEYASQVDAAKVVGSCECGCGSIDFEDDLLADGEPRSEIIADVTGSTPEGRVVTVLLWVGGGFLSYLEIVTYDDLGACGTPHPSWFDGTETSAEGRVTPTRMPHAPL